MFTPILHEFFRDSDAIMLSINPVAIARVPIRVRIFDEYIIRRYLEDVSNIMEVRKMIVEIPVRSIVMFKILSFAFILFLIDLESR